MADFGTFSLAGALPTFIQVDKDAIIPLGCLNGWVFDYKLGYNGTGRTFTDVIVECPPYIQGDNRTIPSKITEFVCLREYYCRFLAPLTVDFGEKMLVDDVICLSSL